MVGFGVTRLAVLLLVVGVGALSMATLDSALAASGCVETPTGIECEYSGTTTSTVATTLPPLRYLATAIDPVLGTCWYWSRYPPGLDSWDPANDTAILTTRWSLPECPDKPGTTTITATTTAWEVFRSFPLAAPSPALRPEVGITNLPTLIELLRPERLTHEEVLPDGRLLEVQAGVETVWVDWGDGSPEIGYPAAVAFGEEASHGYTLKTCTDTYRLDDPGGWRCHPTLDAYPVRVTFSWVGRYRTGGPWILLGTIERAATLHHDVDEVVGVLVAP